MATFHHLHYAALDQIGRREVFDTLATQFDAAFGDRPALAFQQIRNSAQSGGLAGTIAAQNGDDLAIGYLQGHALQDQDDVAVDDLDAINFENDAVGFSHSRNSR